MLCRNIKAHFGSENIGWQKPRAIENILCGTSRVEEGGKRSSLCLSAALEPESLQGHTQPSSCNQVLLELGYPPATPVSSAN